LAALPDRLSLHLLHAQLLAAAGDKTAARAAFEAAVDRFLRTVETHLAFARFYDRAGDTDQAAQQFHEAIDVAPTPDAYLRLAEITILRGDAKEAEQLFEKAASLWPADPVAINGLAYYQVGRLSDAVAALNAAVAVNGFPEAKAAREVLAKLR